MALLPISPTGGLVASVRPAELPDGASPRTFDTDFLAARVLQRPGLNNPFTYSGASVGPSAGGSATDVSLGFAVWQNPGNTLVNTGTFASVTIPLPLPVTAVQGFLHTSGPFSAGYVLVTFSGPVPFAPYGDTYAFSGLTAYTALNGQKLSPTSNPAVAVPTANQALFLFGFSNYARTADTGQAIVTGVSQGTDGLNIEQFGFSLPSNETPQGFKIAVNCYATGTAILYCQLLKAGVPYGNVEEIQPGASPAILTFGGSGDLFGKSWAYSDVNSTSFGIRFTASATNGATVYVGYTTMQVYVISNPANFNYVGQFLSPTGIEYKLALNASGEWFLENTTNSPGVLTPVLLTNNTGAYGSGAEVFDRAFVAMSTLSRQVTGVDIPRQYNFEGGWWDRVTQIGPASPGAVTPTQASGAIANITSVTLTGTLAQITAANTYVAGEVGTFAGITGGAATGLNGQTLIVLSSGLSSSGFQVAFTGAAGGPYSQSGATFTPQYTYPITSITQPAANSDITDPGNLSVLLWSSGPGSTSAGNVLTVYYSPSYYSGAPQPGAQDSTLVTAFNAGYPVYVYISGAAFGNGIYQVTGIGNALPPSVSHYRYYFTVQLLTSNYQLLVETPGTYQITQGTVTTSTPVPGLGPGAQVSIAGTSPSAWNGVYPIVESINAGAFNITQTALSGGTATYTWTLVSGSAPAAGQLVTVTNTLNANGILNVTEALIATASGSTSGTFTITGFASNLTFGTAVEQGQATTAGTQFIIDPGAANVGSTTVNPIYGNATGGTITVVGSATGGTLPIGAGTRQGVWIFITRNGLYTEPSPPVTYAVANGANYVQLSQIPIGPPNVIARLWATTQAGQNGVPGANFYTTTVPTLFTVGGVQYTSSSFLVPDNVSTTAKFTFSDYVLTQSDAIDIPGNNLFNLIEIGNPAVILQYKKRTFYIGCQNKIQNFLNMSFDGGYDATSGGASPLPLGWNVDAAYNVALEGFAQSTAASLLVSPVFGNSFYVVNNAATTAAKLGMITQSAYQDAWNEPILNPDGVPVPYSFRITCRTPAATASGSIVVDLTNSSQGVYGTTLASVTIPLSSLTTTMATYTFSLVPSPGLATIPPGLLLRIWGENIPAGGNFEIDRIEMFDANHPVLTNVVWVSYADEPEQVDIQTGQLTLNSSNENPVYGATIIQDQLSFKKSTSLIEVEEAENYEPAFWNTRETSQAGSGAVGPNAFSQGADWDLSLHRTGINVFEGGKPAPISRELQAMQIGDSLWDQINWNAAQTFWLTNDLRARRFYVGVAMNTPNFWLPNASAATPTQPNVILMCNYDGCPTPELLEDAAPVHVTMFGNLKAMDMRRKWSIWQIASPFAGICLDGSTSYDTLFLCNGIASGKIYKLLASDIQMTDDGTPIAPLYTTSGQPGQEKAAQLGIGMGQKYVAKWMANVQGSAAANGLRIRMLPNTVSPTYPVTAPYIPPLTPTMQNNIEWRSEVRGQRIFIEFSMNQTGTPQAGYFELGEVVCDMTTHPFGDFRGASS